MVTYLFLVIEFIDELVFGFLDSSWPLIRSDLQLTYIQIGLALSLPGMIANFIEPFIGILGDVWKRRLLILGGGILFIVSLFLTALSGSFLPLLMAQVLFNPSSGAFVSLSQASLMDAFPDRNEQNMARWTFAGSLGVVVGPLVLTSMLFTGLGWRAGFFLIGGMALLTLLAALKLLPREDHSVLGTPSWDSIIGGFRGVFESLRQRNVLRWLVLLEFSDLMLDVLYGFLALYFVDVVRFTPANAALAVAVWTGVGLLGDFILIPLLERINGLFYLRWSVVIELVLFPAFLLAQPAWAKVILVGLMGFFNSGWYAILRARLYSAVPGRSGSVMALDNVAGLFGKLLPFGIGLAAQAFGLKLAMWLLLAGPIALMIGLPGSLIRSSEVR